MVTLIIGKKGSGKTKKLIALANDTAASSTGNVVVIEKGAKLTYDITHKARLIDSDQYGISGYDMLLGFLSVRHADPKSRFISRARESS